MKIAIVIIDFDGAQDTLECIESINIWYKHHNENIKIYLVDNSLKNPLDVNTINSSLKIDYIRSEENVGFAEGNNLGMRKAMKDGVDIVALINNDTKFIDNSLLETIDYLNSKEDIGIIGLVNYYYSDPNKVWQAGFNINRQTLSNRTITEFDKNQKFIPCDYVPGSSILIKSNVVKTVGFLDKNYFAYYEEIDFCLKAKIHGFKIGFNPQSIILHKVGASSDSLIKLYLRTRNFIFYSNKYLPKSNHIFQSFLFVIRVVLKIIFSRTKVYKKLKIVFMSINDYKKNNMYKGSLHKVRNL